MSRETITLRRAISLWEVSLRAARKADRTIDGYVRAVEYLERAAHIGQHADPASISVEDLERIVAAWPKRLSNTTVHNRQVAWRQFFAWGARYGWPDPTAQMQLAPKDEPELRRLTTPEWEAILAAPVHEIDLTAVWVLAFAILRRSELMNLTWGFVDLDGETMRVFLGKGRKGRLVPLHPLLVARLRLARAIRGETCTSDACYVLPRRDGYQFVDPSTLVRWREPAADNAVDRLVKKAATTAGVRNPDEITSHMFRRYLLERMQDDGTSPYIAAALAGHRSIQTTAKYGGGASLRAVRAAVAAIDFVTPTSPMARDIDHDQADPDSMELVGIEPTPGPDSLAERVGLEPGPNLVPLQAAEETGHSDTDRVQPERAPDAP